MTKFFDNFPTPSSHTVACLTAFVGAFSTHAQELEEITPEELFQSGPATPNLKLEQTEDSLFNLSFPSTPGRTYDLYYSTDLGNFTRLSGDWNGDASLRAFTIDLDSLETRITRVTLDFWSNVSGSLSDFINTPSFLGNPDGTLEVGSLTVPSFKATSYGGRMSSQITAPESGSYTFYLSSGGQAELYLSTTDQIENSVKIAEVTSAQAGLQPNEWETYNSQISNTVSLTEGNHYHIGIIYLGEIPNQHTEVAWKLPGSDEIQKIDDTHLSETPIQPLGGIELNEHRGFFSIAVSDQDQDGDSLLDWQEMTLAKHHEFLFFDSTSNAVSDDSSGFSYLFNSASETPEFSLLTTDATAIEDNTVNDHGEVTIRRTGSIATTEIMLCTGPACANGLGDGKAGIADYQLFDQDGSPITDTLTFELGEMKKVLTVKALPDAEAEHLETLHFALAETTADSPYFISPTQNESTVLLFDSSSPDDADLSIRNAKASRFLAQASMGGSVDTIEALSERILAIGYLPACEEWIDEQFALTRGIALETQIRNMMSTDGMAYTGNSSFDHWYLGWWDQAITSPEQLRHRMAFALSQIIVTSTNYWNGLYRSRYLDSVVFYDLLLTNAFTSHRELLDDVTYNPFMGVWLSHAQNDKGDPALEIYPDENYAREIMQLFSCGVYSRDAGGRIQLNANGNPIENYDIADIREFAQVFTGLSINDQRGFFGKNLTLLGSGPLQMKNDHHDTSEKHLLNGVVIPAGNSGNTDINLALDNLAEHPSTAPHFGRLLIQRFTSSNPSPAYISRVTEAWQGNGPYGIGVNGDFQAVLKAILLDPEVRDAIHYVKPSSGNDNDVLAIPTDPMAGKIKEPLLKMTQFHRFAKPLSQSPDGYLRIVNSDRAQGQDILKADTVFNFYDSDFSPSDGPAGDAIANFESQNPGLSTSIVAPEAQILGQNAVSEFEKFYPLALSGPNSFSHNGVDTTTEFVQITNLKNQVFVDDAALIRYLDVMLCHGQLPDSLIQKIATELEDNGETEDEKFAQVLSTIWASSAYSVAQ